MRGRVKMRAVMLQHPEAAREVAIFLDGGVNFGFKIFFVSGPGHELVVDCVAEIEHAGFSGGYALQQRVSF